MKKLLTISILSSALFFPISANADNLLTGDVRLACEAILCLSSGNRPSECTPSINRFFSIHHRKLSDTLNARLNFLNLCPSSHEKNMPQLIRAIANGAGRCDAAALNRIGHYVGSREDRRFVISTTKPSYCTAYEDHEWTDIQKTKLVPVYCPNPKYNTSHSRYGYRYNKNEPKEIQCGQKWIDVK